MNNTNIGVFLPRIITSLKPVPSTDKLLKNYYLKFKEILIIMKIMLFVNGSKWQWQILIDKIYYIYYLQNKIY